MANPLLRFLDSDGLEEEVRELMLPLQFVAEDLDEALPDGAEKTTGFRKLVEARDCFIRAAS